MVTSLLRRIPSRSDRTSSSSRLVLLPRVVCWTLRALHSLRIITNLSPVLAGAEKAESAPKEEPKKEESAPKKEEPKKEEQPKKEEKSAPAPAPKKEESKPAPKKEEKSSAPQEPKITGSRTETRVRLALSATACCDSAASYELELIYVL